MVYVKVAQKLYLNAEVAQKIILCWIVPIALLISSGTLVQDNASYSALLLIVNNADSMQELLNALNAMILTCTTKYKKLVSNQLATRILN